MKPGWKKVRFGEVVRNMDENERNPVAAGLERLVGLEHLDPESLHLRRWSEIHDETSFTRVFRRGQMLFGKRRSYQRKAALADFDGICSGDILVFEARKEALEPGLLPFLVQSEGFFQHALGTSAGSLSPRTKWKDLALYEFVLPPRDEQRKIAELLWAADLAVEKWKLAVIQCETIRKCIALELMERAIVDNWPVVEVGDVLNVCQYGLSKPIDSTGVLPILRMGNIQKGKVIGEDLKYIELTDCEASLYKLQRDDILFNRTNSIDLVGKLGIFRLQGDYVFASYLIRLRTNELALPDYLNFFLNSDVGQSRIMQYVTVGVSQCNVNASNLRKIKMPLPPLSEQEEIVTRLGNVHMAESEILEHQQNGANLKGKILTNLLASS